MKKIVYTRPDGGVSVVHPCVSRDDFAAGMTEGQALARALARGVPPYAQNVTILDESEIPSDRSKRWAWRLQGGAIIVDPNVPEPEPVRRQKRIESLKAIRQARPWSLPEQQEMLDLISGV